MKVSKKIKKIFSVILTIAMVITMLPQGQLIKAADGMDIDIHFYDAGQAYEGKVYLQYWQPGTATISTEGEEFAAWNVTRYPLLSEESTEVKSVSGETEDTSSITPIVYNEDGTVTFTYVSDGTTVATNGAIGVYGNVKTSQKKSLLTTTKTEQEDGTVVYTATSGAIVASGVYNFDFYQLDEDGAIDKKLKMPSGGMTYAGSGVFVRNPVVSTKGLVTVYYPYGEEGVTLYYRNTNTNTTEKETLKTGDKVTSGSAVKLGYTEVQMTKDKDFSGAAMYSAKFFDKDGTYSYVLVNAEGVVVKDLCNANETQTFVEKDVDIVALSVDSPVVQDDGSTVRFMYYDSTSVPTEACVAGSFNGWKIGATPMEKDDNDIWSIDIKDFAPGVYEYKFVLNGGSWIMDPLAKYTQNGNCAFVVPGLALEQELKVQLANTLELLKKISKYTGYSLTPEKVEATFALKDETVSGAAIKDGVLEVSPEFEGTSIELVVTDGETSRNCTVEVTNEMYTYTVHYHANEKVDYSDRDMWIWPEGGAYNTGFVFNEENYTDETGRVWGTATYQFPEKALNVIIRSAGVWDYQEDTRVMTIPEGQESGEFWIIEESKQVYTKWAENFDLGKMRYVVVEYDRPEGDYEGWNFYTWTAVTADKNKSNFFEKVNDTYQTTIRIEEDQEKVEYLLRSGTPQKDDWSDVTKDLDGDRIINTPLDQTVIKVRLTQGSLEAQYVPFNKGYELDGSKKEVQFFYRDDDLFMKDTQEQLADVQVEVNGQFYDMTYNKENERYEYTMTGIEEKEYNYRYIVTTSENATVKGETIEGNKVAVLDKFNERTNAEGTYSVFDYKALASDVTVTTNAQTLNYNQNIVLQVTLSNEEIKVAEAYADLTALGGKEKVAIDPELMKLTLSTTSDTEVGAKVIPVTVVDQYNNIHNGSVTVAVVERVKKDEKDFDWDEAVIYFMITDRFKDGDASNNDAYNAGDYNLEGTSSYHGGDFKGVTEKLDYLKDLGINTIWITPVVENILTNMEYEGVASYGYAGYWASSFEKLNKHLGTVEEFHTLIDEAHNRGIRIMVDVVLNHSGYGTESSEDFAGMYREKNVEGHTILGSQDGLPDFATENAEVRAKLINWQKAWVETIGKTDKGNTIDYFRVDTVKHVESTTWSAFKNTLAEAFPEFKMIGECYGASYTEDYGYLHSGTFDSLLDFSMNDVANKFVQGTLDSVEEQLETRNKTINSAGTFGSFLNSHDEDGLKYSLSSLKDENGKAMYTATEVDGMVKVAAALNITAKGQPVIYYGEEIGLSGANNYPIQENRYDMKFDNLSADEQSMLTHYKTLLAARNKYSEVFARGTRTKVAGGDADKYLAFERSYKDQSVVVGLNITEQEKEVTLTVANFANATITDAYSGKEYKADANGKVTVTIPVASKGGTILLAGTKVAIQEPTQVPDADNAQTATQTPSQATQTPEVTTTPAPIIVKTVTANAILAAKKAGTAVSASAVDGNNTVNVNWTFSKNDIARASENDIKDVNLSCTVMDSSKVANVSAILEKDSKNETAVVVSFEHESGLGVNAKASVKVAEQKGIVTGSTVYVYRLDNKKLQQLSIGASKVSADGFVDLYLAQGGTYVILNNRPSDSVVTTLIQKVGAKVNKTALKKGKTGKATVTLPSATMKKVAKLNLTNMKKVQSAQVGATVTYSSSNKKIVAVNSSGKLTAKKKGKATITITVRLSDGEKKVVNKTIEVKK